MHHELDVRRSDRFLDCALTHLDTSATEVELVVVASDRAHRATYHISAQGSQLARRGHVSDSIGKDLGHPWTFETTWDF